MFDEHGTCNVELRVLVGHCEWKESNEDGKERSVIASSRRDLLSERSLACCRAATRKGSLRVVGSAEARRNEGIDYAEARDNESIAMRWRIDGRRL